mmetsp:Transcript_41120/g.106256  ORF Transcript_41120/g.106256 Transcript_41120/m.106256 type:complete len:86 (+) Transcript_41120:130-387(+)
MYKYTKYNYTHHTSSSQSPFSYPPLSSSLLSSLSRLPHPVMTSRLHISNDISTAKISLSDRLRYAKEAARLHDTNSCLPTDAMAG